MILIRGNILTLQIQITVLVKVHVKSIVKLNGPANVSVSGGLQCQMLTQPPPV